MKPIKYYYRLLFFGIIFPVLLISASLSCFYSWKNITNISSRVSKEIKPRVEAVINSLVSSISEEVFFRKEKLLKESYSKDRSSLIGLSLMLRVTRRSMGNWLKRKRGSY